MQKARQIGRPIALILAGMLLGPIILGYVAAVAGAPLCGGVTVAVGPTPICRNVEKLAYVFNGMPGR